MTVGTAGGTAALDSGTRELTRVVVLFSLTGRLDPGRPSLGSLVDRFDFGRFALHLKSSEAVLPVPVLVEDVAPEELRLPHGDHGLDLASVEFAVLATPRGDITLALDCGFAGQTLLPPSRRGSPTPASTGTGSRSAPEPCSTRWADGSPAGAARLRPERPPTGLSRRRLGERPAGPRRDPPAHPAE